MQVLYIVRHGKTDWNDQKLLQGQTDIELNQEGIKAAKNLQRVIKQKKIDLCISSPLKRARDTAKILSASNYEIIYDDRLKERSYGIYEGTVVLDSLIEKHWDYHLQKDEIEIESMHECLERAKNFLEDIQKKYPHQNILIISHGSLIKALHYNLLGYDEHTDFLSFFPENTKIYEYFIENDK